jgi:cell division transport system permease protein
MSTRWVLPLSGDSTDRFLPWIIGLMVFLAALALAFAVGLGGAVARWEKAESSAITIVLPPGSVADDGRAAAVQAALAGVPGIAATATLDRAAALLLLRPWLGEGIDGADLPLPVLIDVTLDGRATVDLAELRAKVAAIAPDADVDSRDDWLAPLIETARTIRSLAVAVVALIGLAGIATVAFTTTTGLAVHHDAIELLHLTGAHDGFIARQFQRQAVILGLVGGLIGLALAGGAYVLVARVADRLAAPLLPRLTLDPLGLAILASLPLVAAGIAALVARLTVMRALARLP